MPETAALLVAYWVTVSAVVLATLAVIVVTTVTKKNDLITVAAGLLAVVLVLVALPVEPAPPTLAITLGVAALAISSMGGGPAATYVLRLATRGSVAPGGHGGILVFADPTAPRAEDGHVVPGARREVLRGGTTIGYLERFATTAALISGFPEAIAVIIAIKGVGRFSELSTAEARERFIIGTLTSLIWACAAAAIVMLGRS